MNQLKLFFISVLFVLSGCSCSNQSNRPDHIVIVMEENHGYDQIVGSSDAPYINSLIEDGLLFTNSHGVRHPSQPNYIALFSGATQGVNNDRCLEDDTPYSTPNLGHTLIDNGFTFIGYSETMPKEGFKGCRAEKGVYNGSPLYARKHNPWVNWQGNTPTGLPAKVNRTLEQFPTNFDELPTVSFVIPNEDNDMHNGPDSLSIKRGDAWLKTHLDDYVQWAKKNNSLFILTFDEDDFTPKNRIPTVFVGQHIKTGHIDSTTNHYNVLRTIEKFYDLPATGPAKEKAMSLSNLGY